MKRFGDDIDGVLGKFLREHQFDLAEEHYHWSAFGSAYVIYERRGMQIRFVDDRKEHEVRCEVRRDKSGEWKAFNNIVAPENPHVADDSLKHVAIAVEINLEAAAKRLRAESNG